MRRPGASPRGVASPRGMGARLSQVIEWLFIAPWRLVAIVALVALPLLVTSELSARDQRERLRASEAREATSAAERAAGTFADHLFAVRTGLALLRPSNLTSGPIAPYVGLDIDRVQQALRVAISAMGDEVARL